MLLYRKLRELISNQEQPEKHTVKIKKTPTEEKPVKKPPEKKPVDMITMQFKYAIYRNKELRAERKPLPIEKWIELQEK